jgi:zinc/manganese transport system permease protein
MAFLIVVAVATTMAVPVVGALLIFSLLIGPPAAARSFTDRPAVAVVVSVVIAVGTVWISIAASYESNLPIAFYVGAIGAGFYGLGRAWTAAQKARPLAPGSSTADTADTAGRAESGLQAAGPPTSS